MAERKSTTISANQPGTIQKKSPQKLRAILILKKHVEWKSFLKREQIEQSTENDALDFHRCDSSFRVAAYYCGYTVSLNRSQFAIDDEFSNDANVKEREKESKRRWVSLAQNVFR